MATMISNGLDVVAFLKEQHQQIKVLFREVRLTTGDARSEAFYALRRLLAVHETAEEEIVHPAARKSLVAAEIVDIRLQEEKKAKVALAALEGLAIDSHEFESRLSLLEADVIAHAEAEERQEFEPLGDSLDSERLERMRSAVIFAERVAPTRPHPGVESQAANLLTGPFAAMLDRARDVLTGKSSNVDQQPS